MYGSLFFAQNLRSRQALRIVVSHGKAYLDVIMKRNPYRKIKIEKQKKLMPDYNGCVFACGNKKIPQSTIMANLTSAHNCPAKESGLCRVGKYCYAFREERYPNPLNKNLKVEGWIENASSDDIYELLESYIDYYENQDHKTETK